MRDALVKREGYRDKVHLFVSWYKERRRFLVLHVSPETAYSNAIIVIPLVTCARNIYRILDQTSIM